MEVPQCFHLAAPLFGELYGDHDDHWGYMEGVLVFWDEALIEDPRQRPG